MKKILSVLILFVVVLNMGVFQVNAEDIKIKYEFSGQNKNDSGYAEGKISFTAPEKGMFYLYWADEKGALPNFYDIASFSLENGQKAEYEFREHVAIPQNATKIILSSNSESDNADINSASLVYTLPDNKIVFDKEYDYRFLALSDVHIDRQDGGSNIYYINSDDHFKKALEYANDIKADFIVSAGDEVTNASGSTQEWLIYQKIIADSSFTNPIYESIGNHEMRFSKYTDCSPKCGIEEFMLATGLNNRADNTVNSKPYFEYTAENGDHFIYMALENGPDPSIVDNFSDEQLNWFENLLVKYYYDGHKIFLIQHSPIYGYGAGDDVVDPAYEGTMRLSDTETGETFKNNKRFKDIIEKYPDIIWLSGHSHIDLRDDVNYSNENNTSCNMIHIPSCSNTTRIIKDETDKNVLDYTFYDDTTQGYIVDVFDKASIFYGVNFYYNKIYPEYSYVIGEHTKKPEEILYGDVDLNNAVEIIDATMIQKSLVNIVTLSEKQEKAAKVDGDTKVNIIDASLIQKKIANIIDVFPVEKQNENIETGSTGVSDSSILEKAKGYLDAYYQYASYYDYMMLKKAYKSGDEKDIEKALNNFDILHSKVWADTVYFTDIYNMGNVKAYSWTNNPMESWPGQKATYIKVNSHGQTVYAVTIDYKKYKNIIFNNGKESGATQTKDILLDGKSGKVYYPKNDSSPYEVDQSVFEQMWYE